MARIRTEEEKEAARQAAKQAKKDQWLREQEEKRPIHEKYMKDAIRQAKKAAALGEVPIGCVIVHDGQVIGRGYNRRNTDKSTVAHAEITAIKRASKKLGDWRLEECTLYVTLEPCQMCSGALVQSRIDEVVIGCMNAKAGCAGSVMNLLQVDGFNHQVKIMQGVLEEECSSMLSFSESFVRKRSRKRQPLKLHRKIRRENRNNKSKRQTKTGRILKAIRVIKVIKVIEVTGLMLQAEIKRGE